MKKGLLLFVSLALAVVACSNNSQSNKSSSNKEPVDPSYKETTLKVESSYDGEEEREYELTFAYKDSMFAGKTSEFNNDLAMLSYGMSVATEEKEMLVKFNKDLGFTNTEYASEYDEKPKVKGVGYGFATKYVGDYNLVAVAVRGFNYRVQWVDNFNVGTEGDHLGFSESADLVIEALNTYVGKIKNSKPTKLWIAGYSRGGAIANVMSSKILTNTEAKFNRDNMYVYTFEAPRGLTQEHAIAYENVFNIVNPGDVFTRVCPEEYDLYRCGIDVDIYDKNVDALIKAFDDKAVIPELSTSILYKDDVQWAKYFVQCLLAGDEPEEGERNWSASTRELYNLNYGDDLRYIIIMINAAEDVTLMDFVLSFQGMSATEIASYFIGTAAGFVMLVTSILDDLKVAYDEGELTEVLMELYNYVSKPTVALALASLLSKDTGARMIAMHKPDTTYILLNAYINKE